MKEKEKGCELNMHYINLRDIDSCIILKGVVTLSPLINLIYSRLIRNSDKRELTMLNLLDEFYVSIRGCKLVSHKPEKAVLTCPFLIE